MSAYVVTISSRRVYCLHTVYVVIAIGLYLHNSGCIFWQLLLNAYNVIRKSYVIMMCRSRSLYNMRQDSSRNTPIAASCFSRHSESAKRVGCGDYTCRKWSCLRFIYCWLSPAFGWRLWTVSWILLTVTAWPRKPTVLSTSNAWRKKYPAAVQDTLKGTDTTSARPLES